MCGGGGRGVEPRWSLLGGSSARKKTGTGRAAETGGDRRPAGTEGGDSRRRCFATATTWDILCYRKADRVVASEGEDKAADGRTTRPGQAGLQSELGQMTN